MIKEAFDAGFNYGVTLALEHIKQAQDYAVAANIPENYWARIAQLYGLTPEELQAQVAAQQAQPEYGATEEYPPEMYGAEGTQGYYAPEQLFGATSNYYPYY